MNQYYRHWIYNGEQDKVPALMESGSQWIIPSALIPLGLGAELAHSITSVRETLSEKDFGAVSYRVKDSC